MEDELPLAGGGMMNEEMSDGCGLPVRRIGLIPFPEVAQIRPVSPHVLELILKSRGVFLGVSVFIRVHVEKTCTQNL